METFHRIITTSALVAAAATGVAYYHHYQRPLPILSSLISRLPSSLPLLNRPPTPTPISHGFVPTTPLNCPLHTYTTTLLSLSPLPIYIHNFTTPSEAVAIVASGAPNLTSSPITGAGRDTSGTPSRTSRSAPLDGRNDAVACVLERARRFMAPALLLDGRDDMGAAQMVQYTSGQKFDLHRDWFARPRVDAVDVGRGRRRMWNRMATIFAVLECEGCGDSDGKGEEAGGETWFPEIRTAVPPREDGKREDVAGRDGLEGRQKRQKEKPLWREHPDGGLAFRPIPGNAIFWVNLFPNGTGDARVVHAGLPVSDGVVKTAMNIWPRRFFGPDA